MLMQLNSPQAVLQNACSSKISTIKIIKGSLLFDYAPIQMLTHSTFRVLLGSSVIVYHISGKLLRKNGATS